MTYIFRDIQNVTIEWHKIFLSSLMWSFNDSLNNIEAHLAAPQSPNKYNWKTQSIHRILHRLSDAPSVLHSCSFGAPSLLSRCSIGAPLVLCRCPAPSSLHWCFIGASPRRCSMSVPSVLHWSYIGAPTTLHRCSIGGPSVLHRYSIGAPLLLHRCSIAWVADCWGGSKPGGR